MKADPRQAAFLSPAMRSNCGLMHSQRHLHGSCVSRNGEAILLIGAPGTGKSDLVLRLLSRGFDLVADDRVIVTDGIACGSPELAGLLEVRGLGIVRLPFRAQARVVLVVELAGNADRMPMPERYPDLDLPLVRIDPAAASAPDRVVIALECATGRLSQVAGAFAA
jgi:HPr kinase/phosphorylase